MVSLTGARNVDKLVREIDRLTQIIADMDQAIAKANTNEATIYKIELHAYVNEVSRTLTVADLLSPAETKTVLTGLRTVLNNKLTAANAALTAIT